MVVDIGGGTTGIAIFREGSIWYTAVLPVGGKQITSDLAMWLDTSYDTAEDLKLRAGTLCPEWKVQPKGVEMLETYGTSVDEVSYIIRARVEEIFRMIRSKVPCIPEIVVVTGGTAALPGMDIFAQEVLDCQVWIGIPKFLPEDTKGLDHPRYASAVGIMILGSRREGPFRNGNGLKHLYSGLCSGLVGVTSRFPRFSFNMSLHRQPVAQAAIQKWALGR